MKSHKNILKKALTIFVFVAAFLAPLSISINDAATPGATSKSISPLDIESSITHAVDVVGLVGGAGPAAVGEVAEKTSSLTGDIASSLGRWLGNALLNIASYFTWTGGMLLEVSIDKVVIGFGSWINHDEFGGMIDDVWGIVRDMANILFIFGFIFIGIKLIINGSDSTAKSMLAQLIIAALLINFSLFITKAIIEVSNLLAYSMYEAMTQNGGTIPKSIVNILEIQSIYKPTAPGTLAGLTTGGSSGFFFMGAIFLIITAFAFFNGALMLLSRFVGLVFIMMFSPILFAAQIFPQTQKYAQDLWSKLFSYSFYAPAYIFLIFVAILVLDKLPLTKDNIGFSEVLGNPETSGGDFFSVVLNFVIAIMVIQAATTLASKMGLAGSELALKITEGGKNMVKNQTLGRAGRISRNYGSNLLRRFEKSYEKDDDGNKQYLGIAGRLGDTAIGKTLLKFDPLLEKIQEGGMYYKRSMQERATQLKGLRNHQLKRKLAAWGMSGFGKKGYLGKYTSMLQNREALATGLATMEKQDIDEIDPELMDVIYRASARTGHGITKYKRTRPDVGNYERYDDDGNHVFKLRDEKGKPLLDKDGNIQYKVLLKTDIKRNEHGFVDYEKSGGAVTDFKYDEEGNIISYKVGEKANEADELDYEFASSEISSGVLRTKYSRELRAIHPRSVANTAKGRGGYHSVEGARDKQIEEVGDAWALQFTGEMAKAAGKDKDAKALRWYESLRTKNGVNEYIKEGMDQFDAMGEYLHDLADEFEKRGDSDMVNRLTGQAAYITSLEGRRDLDNMDRAIGIEKGGGTSRRKGGGSNEWGDPEGTEYHLDDAGDPIPGTDGKPMVKNPSGGSSKKEARGKKEKPGEGSAADFDEDGGAPE